ncbi:hypothetical protein SK854_17870 [Lentzea sp. BCCO 10_0061]|uniref:Lipoprotein n=1 Tax=Lentzea sokolovensis TaxID=3095429 RepID=A0ABU4UX14_9PSEU|nr:hypothetical protein [Lentzea sp. BCCO 10_0061]MDX8143991.1 hypothetical protein [Lentzea sp. BCCO 10_0061]
MGRVLGAFLLVLVAGCSAPPPEQPSPNAITTIPEEPTYPPEFRSAEEVGPLTPTDWLYIGGGAARFGPPLYPQYRHRIRYGGRPTKLMVHFHNAGDVTVTAPTIAFRLLPIEWDTETIVIGADGDGWTCETTEESATCRTAAEVAPGEVLPRIAVEVTKHPDSVSGGPGNGHDFTATFDDIVYEGHLDWDTSV